MKVGIKKLSKESVVWLLIHESMCGLERSRRLWAGRWRVGRREEV